MAPEDPFAERVRPPETGQPALSGHGPIDDVVVAGLPLNCRATRERSYRRLHASMRQPAPEVSAQSGRASVIRKPVTATLVMVPRMAPISHGVGRGHACTAEAARPCLDPLCQVSVPSEVGKDHEGLVVGVGVEQHDRLQQCLGEPVPGLSARPSGLGLPGSTWVGSGLFHHSPDRTRRPDGSSSAAGRAAARS